MKSLFFTFSLAVAAMAPALAEAQQAVPVHVLPAEQGWISRVEDFLNAATVSHSRFQQIAPDGTRTTGTAWLARPGRMRFDYDKPSPLLLVANNGQIVYQDRDLGQVTTIPVDRTPLGLLLRENLKLSGDVTIIGFRHDRGLIQITVVRTATPSEGSLTLIFNDQPLALKSWVVKDAQGRETQIDLFNTETGAAITPHLFDLPKEQD